MKHLNLQNQSLILAFCGLPELYDKGFDLVSQEPVLEEVFQNPDYKDLTEIQKTWRALVTEFAKAEQKGIKLNKYSYWGNFSSTDFIYEPVSEFDLNMFLNEVEWIFRRY